MSEVMQPGPSTYRPDVEVSELVSKLERRGFKTALVTSPEGRLIGLFRVDAPEVTALRSGA